MQNNFRDNIAEGSRRGSLSQFGQFLGFTQGSAFELETQLLLIERINLLSSNDVKKAVYTV